MAAKPDIQYVTQFYSYGSEAKVLQLKTAKKKQKTQLPKAVPQQKIMVAVDPVAVAGIVIALMLVVLMVVSAQSYMDVCNEYAVMTERVVELQNDNVLDQQKYREMYDLADIEEKALALGMIPMEDAQVVIITPVMPEETPEPTWWEDVSWFLKGLFA
jgi:hypothetical protein